MTKKGEGLLVGWRTICGSETMSAARVGVASWALANIFRHFSAENLIKTSDSEWQWIFLAYLYPPSSLS